MPMTIEEKANQIVEDIRQEKGINPVHIFKNMAKKDYISIHGPEHHILYTDRLLQCRRRDQSGRKPA